MKWWSSPATGRLRARRINSRHAGGAAIWRVFFINLVDALDEEEYGQRSFGSGGRDPAEAFAVLSTHLGDGQRG
jgi:hypothetical protein